MQSAVGQLYSTSMITLVGNRLNPKFWSRANAQPCSVLTIMSTSGLKAIAPVPTAADFLDIVLSKTQRKTPTVRSLVVASVLTLTNDSLP